MLQYAQQAARFYWKSHFSGAFSESCHCNANSKVDRPTDHCAHCLHTTSSSAAATFLRRSDTLQRLKRMCVSRKTNTAGHILWTQEVAGGCQHDPKALFACIPASVKPGPAPPPPPPSHTKRKHAPCKPQSSLDCDFFCGFLTLTDHRETRVQTASPPTSPLAGRATRRTSAAIVAGRRSSPRMEGGPTRR